MKTQWASLKGWLGEKSEKVGGPAEKRNLLGVCMDIGGGIVCAPFKVVGATWQFAKLVFNDPTEGMRYLRFQWARGTTAFFALGGVKRTVHVDRDGESYVRWEGLNRAVIFGYITFIIWCFVPTAIQLGYVGVAKGLFFGPMGIWAATGVRGCLRAWKAFKWETWATRDKADQLNAESAGIQDQVEANQRLNQAKQTAAARQGQIEQAALESHALLAQSNERMLALEAELRRVADERDSLKAQAAELPELTYAHDGSFTDNTLLRVTGGAVNPILGNDPEPEVPEPKALTEDEDVRDTELIPDEKPRKDETGALLLGASFGNLLEE